MALTKESFTDKVEVVGTYRAVNCRVETLIKEDGTVLSRAYRRYVLEPSTCKQNADGSFTHTATDISGEPAETQAVCNAVWTDAVKAAWETFCENSRDFVQ